MRFMIGYGSRLPGSSLDESGDYMEFHLVCKRAIIGALLVAATAMAGASNKTIIEAVKAMERELGLMTISAPILAIQIAERRQDPDHYARSAPTISPDGTAIAWWAYPIPIVAKRSLFLRCRV